MQGDAGVKMIQSTLWISTDVRNLNKSPERVNLCSRVVIGMRMILMIMGMVMKKMIMITVMKIILMMMIVNMMMMVRKIMMLIIIIGGYDDDNDVDYK